ncbi:PREDICTED: basic proline-rich protein-like [Cercocebus atys]|uniref:basic proline-rich protein-like n=1 Tax=Cercocebus atys TaxID=9531 RepID=UPI0005F5580D|nr:PREDICTED: basic proline-rich protein-like [Cercocebus atys]
MATRRRGARASEAWCVGSWRREKALSSPVVTPSPAPPSWEKHGSRGRGARREDWLGGPSIPAGSARRPAGRGLQAGTRGRGAGPRRAGGRRAPPLLPSPAPPPPRLPSPPAHGPLGRGGGPRPLGVPPGSVAILRLDRKGVFFPEKQLCIY